MSLRFALVHGCHVREHADYTTLVADEIERFALVVGGAEPATPVPTCPGWELADLIDHVGSIHRWAAYMVRNQSPERVSFRDIDMQSPARREDLPDWLAAGAPALCDAL